MNQKIKSVWDTLSTKQSCGWSLVLKAFDHKPKHWTNLNSDLIQCSGISKVITIDPDRNVDYVNQISVAKNVFMRLGKWTSYFNVGLLLRSQLHVSSCSNQKLKNLQIIFEHWMTSAGHWSEVRSASICVPDTLQIRSSESGLLMTSTHLSRDVCQLAYWLPATPLIQCKSVKNCNQSVR